MKNVGKPLTVEEETNLYHCLVTPVPSFNSFVSFLKVANLGELVEREEMMENVPY